MNNELCELVNKRVEDSFLSYGKFVKTHNHTMRDVRIFYPLKVLATKIMSLAFIHPVSTLSVKMAHAWVIA